MGKLRKSVIKKSTAEIIPGEFSHLFAKKEKKPKVTRTLVKKVYKV